MGKSVVFLFSGQGSQYFHMGKDMYENNSTFRYWMKVLDDQIQAEIGESVISRMFDKSNRKDEPFDRLLYSHPAIFMVEFAMAQSLIADGIIPECVLGSSVGEFAAASVAGLIAPVDALHLLLAHAKAIETHCQAGQMLAVLGSYSHYEDDQQLKMECEMASKTGDTHFVLSGLTRNIEAIKQRLAAKSIITQTLPVRFAFHSSWIDNAAEQLNVSTQTKTLGPSQIGFLSSRYGKRLETVTYNYFWDVVRGPIHFEEAIRLLERESEYVYLDVGPSGTLTNLAKRILSEQSQSECYSIMTPFGSNEANYKRIYAKLSGLSETNSNKKGRSSMNVYLFPGQGSQHKGMGGELFDQYRDLTEKADRILGYSIKELCLLDPHRQLGQTQYTQVALYVVSALSFYKKVEQTNQLPDYVAGHSLGEYNALLAAGAFDFETGLKLVKRRGELMSQAPVGGMAAVIGLTIEQVRNILHENHLTGIDVANHNAPSQVVIAGQKNDIAQAQSIFEESGAKMYVPLNVSGAFHSRYMADAQQQFEQFMAEHSFSKLSIPVISNVHAQPYLQEDISSNLIKQIVSPVKWNDTIRYLLGLGEVDFTEVGPGNVLTKLVGYIRKEATPIVPVSSVTTDKMTEKVTGTNNTEIVEGLVTGESLGDKQFKEDYGLKYAYVTGAMYRGIASEKMVIRVAKAGMLGFYGTGGLRLDRIERSIQSIQKELSQGEAYGMNLLHNPSDPSAEEHTISLFLKYGIKNIEASAFMGIVPSLIIYRAKGLTETAFGGISIGNRIIAKLSRPEVAEAFLSPAPQRMVDKLVELNKITATEARLLSKVPMADDICVEADSGGHTDSGVAYALMPAITLLRDEMMKKYGYGKRIRVGAAGGIGTPVAAMAAFMLGADFIVTGSINQCTIEADTSDAAKDLLQEANVQDTAYAPAGDMFEIGAKVQVLKKGLFFPVRANKLYELYKQYNSIDEIDEKTKRLLQEKYFNRSFEEVYQEVLDYQPPQEIEKAERNTKHKMALIFRWYFGHSTRLAMSGQLEHKVDFQIHCGPALGSFNQWVKGTAMESWRNRHVDEIGITMMRETAALVNARINAFKTGSLV
ncbi:ACP S-malonyltransferase [Paenibacillus sp. JNUCC31]|uniref:ACP S-malonyltransferase n=1 Tax=Paenibacillus sp. JNUCC-31 TaxID=2777983 RepID=UPI001780AC8D|nr:ACP S-malonyltransferase [Paenibacillus sp. JNUCC-31]QOS80433.1 ACP S-malonyltransferase [Paenibacillus sp. JNUCC-31]